jgi:hypothetical protein
MVLDGTYEAYKRMYAALGADNIDQLLMPPPDTTPKPMESGMENSGLNNGWASSSISRARP